MIQRALQRQLEQRLTRHPAVAILGPRQVGKTTLAHELAADRPSLYLDLESPSDLAKLAEPELFLEAHSGELVILDEVQRLPGLFQPLRGLIDEGRRAGLTHGRFLILGSASRDLLRQSAESLAGRIVYSELQPLSVQEVASDRTTQDRLWSRGGFPESFLASNDEASLEWRRAFIRTYLERDVPQLGSRIPAETLRRFWTMLAHEQGRLLNASRIGAGLGINGQTVARYIDLLVDLLLVRRLTPLLANVGKRLVRSPRVYVRDSGLVHALLGLRDLEALLGHPVVGHSWEGFVIESLLAAAPPGAEPHFYRTTRGAEIDLVITQPDGRHWAFEIKRSAAPKPRRGFHFACDDIAPVRRLLVYPGSDRFPLGQGVEAIGLPEAAHDLLETASG